MSSRQVKAVIFDLDGTLIDSQKSTREADKKITQMINEHLKHRKLNLTKAQILEEICSFDDKMNREIKYDRDKWWQIIVNNLGVNMILSKAFIRKLTIAYWHAYARSSKPYRDTLSTLRYLKKNSLLLGLLTDTDVLKDMKKLRISKLPFRHFFDAIVIAGEDTAKTKPSPEPYELIARKLGVSASECVFVGDRPFTDIKGAKITGMKTILVCKRDWRMGEKADWTIRSLSELHRIL
jgi:putative hydrolase of the HAD superfamily